jgi:transposase
MAIEAVADLVATDTKLKTMTKELAAAVQARGSHLMDLHGIGPATTRSTDPAYRWIEA